MFHLERSLKSRPEDTDLLRRLANANTRAGRWQAAATDWTRLLELDDSSGEDWDVWARTQEHIGNLQEALRGYTEATARRPKDGTVWLRLSLVHARSSQLEKANTAFFEALTRGLDLRLRVGFDGMPRDGQELHEVRSLWQPLLAILTETPSDSNAVTGHVLRARGLAHAVLDDWERATEFFSRAVELMGNDLESHRGLALCAFRRQSWGDSLAHADLALEQHPGDGDLRFLRARLMMMQNRVDEARSDLDLAIAGGADHAVSRALRGNILLDRGQVEAADRDFSRVVDQTEKDAREAFRLGNFFARLGKWKLAADSLERASRMNPKDLNLWYYCALASLQAGRNQQYAETVRSRLSSVDAERSAGRINHLLWSACLGPAEVSLGLESHADVMRKVVEAEPANHAYLNTYGALLCRVGRYAEAIEQLTKSLRHAKPEDKAWDWLFLAIARHHAGRNEAARESLARARETTSRVATNQHWQARAELDILLREVEGLLLPP